MLYSKVILPKLFHVLSMIHKNTAFQYSQFSGVKLEFMTMFSSITVSFYLKHYSYC